jgi:hypothetical protein
MNLNIRTSKISHQFRNVWWQATSDHWRNARSEIRRSSYDDGMNKHPPDLGMWYDCHCSSQGTVKYDRVVHAAYYTWTQATICRNKFSTTTWATFTNTQTWYEWTVMNFQQASVQSNDSRLSYNKTTARSVNLQSPTSYCTPSWAKNMRIRNRVDENSTALRA